MVCKWYNLCPLSRFERLGKLDQSWADDYCKTNKNWKKCKRYELEEKGQYHPDHMLPNGKIDNKLL